VGEPKGKRPLGRHRHGWEDNIKIDLQEVGWMGGEGMDVFDLAQQRDMWQTFVNAVAYLWVP